MDLKECCGILFAKLCIQYQTFISIGRMEVNSKLSITICRSFISWCWYCIYVQLATEKKPTGRWIVIVTLFSFTFLDHNNTFSDEENVITMLGLIKEYRVVYWWKSLLSSIRQVIKHVNVHFPRISNNTVEQQKNIP